MPCLKNTAGAVTKENRGFKNVYIMILKSRNNRYLYLVLSGELNHLAEEIPDKEHNPLFDFLAKFQKGDFFIFSGDSSTLLRFSRLPYKTPPRPIYGMANKLI